MKKIWVLLFILFPSLGLAQEMGNYLILNDIGGYKYRPKPTKRIYGSSGVLISAGHFYLDHDDVTYETRYILPDPLLGVEVQVTQHAGSDSDKWLFHEVEDAYRSGERETLGLLTKGTRLREIYGNKIISLRGSGYSWISNYIVVEISYTDLDGTKPEPMEILQAYLQKLPSTIPLILLFDRGHDERWIKDEMERRLWLCDKWFLQLQVGKAELNETLEAVNKNMKIFLDYRERYYDIKASEEKGILWGHLEKKDGTAMKNKLTEYKNWWNVNRTRPVNLP